MARVGGNFKALLARMPDAVAEEFRELHNQVGRTVLARARSRVARRTGALSQGLSYKVLPKSLKLKVGIIGKPTNRRLFYGRIVEFGRKAQTVTATRRGTLQRAQGAGLNVRASAYKRAALKAGIGGAYKLRIRAMAPRPFIYTLTREEIYRPYQKLWGRAVHRAAMGAPSQ